MIFEKLEKVCNLFNLVVKVVLPIAFTKESHLCKKLGKSLRLIPLFPRIECFLF